jgi:hypothetical protein
MSAGQQIQWQQSSVPAHGAQPDGVSYTPAADTACEDAACAR